MADKVDTQRTGNEEFPIPCAAFLDSIRGTPDEVWSHWLTKQHRYESHLHAEWHSILDSYRDAPAHPSVLNR